MNTRSLLAMTAALALLVGACGSSDGGDSVSVDDAWSRATPELAENAAVYFSVTADENDAIVAASVDTSVAAEVQLHESMAGMEDGTDDMDDSGATHGMTGMQPVDQIPLAAGDTVTLEPGGLHVMLIGLAERLEEGSSFDLTLDFEKADDMTVTVEVRA